MSAPITCSEAEQRALDDMIRAAQRFLAAHRARTGTRRIVNSPIHHDATRLLMGLGGLALYTRDESASEAIEDLADHFGVQPNPAEET